MSAVPQVQILHLQNRFHCRSLPFQLPPDDPGGEVDEQGQHHEDGGDGEGQRRLPALGGIDVQSHRQGGGGGVQGVEETHQRHAEACRIQQGGTLPHDAADGQNTAGDDAVHRSRQHYGTDHVPFAGTQRQRLHPNFSLDVTAEINFFLDQCMDAASQVADAITLTENTGVFNPLSDSEYSGWNPYFEMFSAEDMSGYSEVLFWKDYLRSGSINISHGAPNYIYSGGNNGMLRSYVQTFLMENGLPWYASNSGFKGDSRIQEEKEGRDQRLQLFLFGEKDKQAPRADGDGTMPEFGEPALFELQEVRDLTGYRIRKCLTYKKDQIISGSDQSTTGCIIYRGVEAYLNYLEAYYLRNGKVDGKAAQYWTAIRKRGGVDTDYEKTIRNTDMSKEVDWAKYSGSTLVDATLFNIRRERRCEFIGEGMRWDDLMRWRAMDQLLTTKYIPEGFNFWDEAYDDYVAMKNDKGEPKYKIVSDGSSTANMSAKELGKYVRPYSIVKANNAVFDGYTFAKAYYLYPVPIRQMELLSPDRSVNNSVLYQNPYWPSKTSEPAIE